MYFTGAAGDVGLTRYNDLCPYQPPGMLPPYPESLKDKYKFGQLVAGPYGKSFGPPLTNFTNGFLSDVPAGLTPFDTSCFQFSSATVDENNRRRCEAVFRDAALVPFNKNMYFAARMMCFSPVPITDHITIMQIHHGMFGAGLSPTISVSLDAGTIGFHVVQGGGDGVNPITENATVKQQIPVAIYNNAPTWFDVIIKFKLSHLASQSPRAQAWFGLVSTDLQGRVTGMPNLQNFGPNNVATPILGPNSYTPTYPANPENNQVPVPEARIGCYCGADPWTPAVVRNVFVKKMVLVDNSVTPRTQADIRNMLNECNEWDTL